MYLVLKFNASGGRGGGSGTSRVMSRNGNRLVGNPWAMPENSIPLKKITRENGGFKNGTIELMPVKVSWMNAPESVAIRTSMSVYVVVLE